MSEKSGMSYSATGAAKRLCSYTAQLLSVQQLSM